MQTNIYIGAIKRIFINISNYSSIRTHERGRLLVATWGVSLLYCGNFFIYHASFYLVRCRNFPHLAYGQKCYLDLQRVRRDLISRFYFLFFSPNFFTLPAVILRYALPLTACLHALRVFFCLFLFLLLFF